MFYLGMLALGLGIGLPIGVIGAGIGQGIAANGALSGIARQPEAANKLQTVMLIALAIIESLVIYSLLIFFLLMGKLPTLSADQVNTLVQAAATAPR